MSAAVTALIALGSIVGVPVAYTIYVAFMDLRAQRKAEKAAYWEGRRRATDPAVTGQFV